MDTRRLGRTKRVGLALGIRTICTSNYLKSEGCRGVGSLGGGITAVSKLQTATHQVHCNLAGHECSQETAAYQLHSDCSNSPVRNPEIPVPLNVLAKHGFAINHCKYWSILTRIPVIVCVKVMFKIDEKLLTNSV